MLSVVLGIIVAYTYAYPGKAIMKRKLYIVALVLFAAAFFNASAVKAENKDWSQDYTYGQRGNDCNNGGYNNNNHNNGPGYSNPSNNGSGNAANGNPSTPAPSTNLPINGGVVFLFVAGMFIGIVTLRKFKTAKPVLIA
jgi:hypothetical protein